MRHSLLAAASILIAFLPAAAGAAVLSPELARHAATLSADQPVAVILTFRDREDLTAHRGGRAGAPDLVRALRERAARSQGRLLALLHGRAAVTGIRPLWIDNSIAARVPAGMLAELQALPELESIDEDAPVRFEDAVAAGGGASVDWHLAMIRADQVWSTYHLDGTGIVVGSMDTGFDPNHPALQGKWRGGSNSWTDIINGLPSPYDDHGHGTHTIGTMVGGDGPGPSPDDIGVAYNAKFISAKVLDATNSFSSASIVISGAQWMLDPDGNPNTNDFPDVISNSWFFNTFNYSGFYYTVQAWQAAGIVPVFCIANFGPSGGTTRPPGNYSNTIGVGATTASDLIASFSSRGPGPSGTPFFPSDRRKPDLSAPGENVRSSVPGGGYEYWSGTSMSTPQVTGTIALMLQGNPALVYSDIRTKLIQTSVDLGVAGYDYDFGYGRLDAFAATTSAITGVGDPRAVAGARLQCAPNPSHGVVRLDYAGPAAGPLTVSVFDLAGRRVWSAVAPGAAGSLTWDLRDRAGARSPGVYLVRLAGDAGTLATQRLLLVN